MPDDERIDAARRGWDRLQQPGCRAVAVGSVEPSSAGYGVLAGSFDPFHPGHLQMSLLAAERLRQPVVFELSISNVDKRDLAWKDVRQRVMSMPDSAAIWLTRCPTFEQKSEVLGPVTFLVGADTIERIDDARYYRDDNDRLRSLRAIAGRGGSFLVFGRRIRDRFLELRDLNLSPQLLELCQSVGGDEFASPYSSTALRRERGR